MSRRSRLNSPAYTTDAAATFAPIKAATIGVLGNSIDALNGPVSAIVGSNVYWNGRGYLHHANVLLGHRLKFTVSAGVGGNTSAQILARLTDITASTSKPKFCVVGSPINDWVNGNTLTLAQSEANMTAVYNGLIAAGVIPVITSCTPSSYIWSDSTAKGNLVGFNAWIRDYARANPAVILFDPYPVLTNQTNGGPLFSLFVAEVDGGHVHPNTPGAAKMGRVLAQALAPHVPSVDMLVGDNTDPGNLLTNGLMDGTVGEGQTPTGWSVQRIGGATMSGHKALVPRIDGKQGNWLEVTVPAGQDLQVFQQNNGIGTAFNVGDSIVGQIEFETDDDFSSTTIAPYLQVSMFGATGYTADLPNSTIDGYNYFNHRKGVLRTPPMVIPTGTTRLQFFLYMGSGGGTVRVSRASIRKESF